MGTGTGEEPTELDSAASTDTTEAKRQRRLWREGAKT